MGISMGDRNEVHVINFANGHEMSSDCWCEPSSIRWMENKYGVQVLVVEHNDYVATHHLMVLGGRNRDMHLGEIKNYRGPDEPWITRALERVMPPSSPPSDPNERSL